VNESALPSLLPGSPTTRLPCFARSSSSQPVCVGYVFDNPILQLVLGRRSDIHGLVAHGVAAQMPFRSSWHRCCRNKNQTPGSCTRKSRPRSGVGQNRLEHSTASLVILAYCNSKPPATDARRAVAPINVDHAVRRGSRRRSSPRRSDG